MNEKLAKMEPQALMEPSVSTMMQAVIEKGITSDNVGALERLCGLYERMQEKDSERAFAVAFNALQSEMPIITATSTIPNRGKYERFEDIMRVISPLLAKHGFTVSFSMDFKESRIVETCHLTHIGGITRSNSFAVRSGGRADSDTQADCKAATTAKRNALCNALNIVIQQDCLNNEDDPRNEGGSITTAQAEELARRVAETNSDRVAFLKYAGAEQFKDIPAGKYAELDMFLAKRERRGR